MRPPEAVDTTGTGPATRLFRRRVQLYLLVMLAVDLVTYITDYVNPLLIEGLEPPNTITAILLMRISVTVFVATLDPRILDGLIFIAIAYLLATAFTSRTIYGLHREVREAMRLGQYTLTELLGEGGMGSVYRAKHAMLRREAAVKLVRPGFAEDEAQRVKALERFEREADVTASLKSPHTVELYDFGVSEDGAFYYVMELLDGIDLESAIANHGPMPASRAVFILRQACESLEEAHAAELVHRDVKPANVFLCRHGIQLDFVKVLDFGLVTLGPEKRDLEQKLTMDGTFAGTPAYVAPEMVTGGSVVDGRADLYALGCVAYWLLTGHAPFERETAMATVLAHVNDEPASPSSASELAIGPALDALILSCLAKNPADRPASAAELGRGLEAAASDYDDWTQEDALRWWQARQPHAARAAEPAGELKLTKHFFS